MPQPPTQPQLQNYSALQQQAAYFQAANHAAAPPPPPQGNGYDAALYSHANSMIQPGNAPKWSSPAMPPHPVGHQMIRPPMQQKPMFKRRTPAQPSQLFYCDVCKISCAGPQVIIHLLFH